MKQLWKYSWFKLPSMPASRTQKLASSNSTDVVSVVNFKAPSPPRKSDRANIVISRPEFSRQSNFKSKWPAALVERSSWEGEKSFNGLCPLICNLSRFRCGIHIPYALLDSKQGELEIWSRVRGRATRAGYVDIISVGAPLLSHSNGDVSKPLFPLQTTNVDVKIGMVGIVGISEIWKIIKLFEFWW